MNKCFWITGLALPRRTQKLGFEVRKKYRPFFHNGSPPQKKVLKYGTPNPSESTLIETLIDPFKEP